MYQDQIKNSITIQREKRDLNVSYVLFTCPYKRFTYLLDDTLLYLYKYLVCHLLP